MADAAGPALAAVRGFPAPAGPVDLRLRAGDLVLLRGGNGCGKTSLLRGLAGLEAPLRPAGVEVQGADPRSLPAAQLASRVHVALQDPAETLAGLTVAGEFRLRRLALPQGLAALAGRDIATLSSGEARRVSLAAASGRPVPLLLLDEPAEGLDAAGRDALLRLVREHRRRGAVVAADHTGLLAGAATAVLDLQPAAPAALPAVPPAPPGGPLLESPAATVDRDGAAVPLPAIRLGPGFHAVRGPNAGGKSTLLLRLAGLLGKGATHAGRPVQPGATARLLLPRAPDLFTRESVAGELDGVAAAVRAAFVPDALLARHPLSLSAGEAQRVALAKCLGRPAPVVLLDEPDAHLDAADRVALVQSVAACVAAGACVVAATHDEALLARAHSTVRLGAP